MGNEELSGAPLTWLLPGPSHWLPVAPPHTLIGCFRLPPPPRARPVPVRYLEGSAGRLPPPPLGRRVLPLAARPACWARPLADCAAGPAAIGRRAGAGRAPPGAGRCVWAGVAAERARERSCAAATGQRGPGTALGAQQRARDGRLGWRAARRAGLSGASRGRSPARTMPSGREPCAPRLRDPSGAAAPAAAGSA